MRKVLVVFLVFIIVLFAVALIFSSLSGNSQKSKTLAVVNAFNSEVLSGNCSAAYKLFTAAAQKATSNNTWLANCGLLFASFSGQKPVLLSEKPSGKQSLLTYKIAGLDGQYDFDFIMDHSSGTWLVSSFTSSLQNPNT